MSRAVSFSQPHSSHTARSPAASASANANANTMSAHEDCAAYLSSHAYHVETLRNAAQDAYTIAAEELEGAQDDPHPILIHFAFTQANDAKQAAEHALQRSRDFYSYVHEPCFALELETRKEASAMVAAVERMLNEANTCVAKATAVIEADCEERATDEEIDRSNTAEYLKFYNRQAAEYKDLGIDMKCTFDECGRVPKLILQ